ncbi:MAG: ATP-binding response regulator [Anaerolineae bacterium]
MLSDSELAGQTRKALAHLDDVIYLDGLALAAQIEPVFGMADQTRGQTLRRAMRLVIDSLGPQIDKGEFPVDATSYHVLYQYAIARQSMVAIASELGISERKAYYALQQSCSAVSRILGDLMADRLLDQHGPRETPPSTARVREELDRLATIEKQDVDLQLIVREAMDSVSRLAEQSGTKIILAADKADYRVASNRVLIRQAIMNLLSSMCATGSTIAITLQQSGNPPEVAITFVRRPACHSASLASTDPLNVASQIIGTLGVKWARTDEGSHLTNIELRVAASQRHTVLIVDDNDGVIALFRRYLRHQPYIIQGAHDYDEAVATLNQELPDVVLLDVMMPRRDGWELLQGMRRITQTRVPVIMCSIINDPKLALSMGASAFLHKPVNRAALLAALNQVFHVEA